MQDFSEIAHRTTLQIDLPATTDKYDQAPLMMLRIFVQCQTHYLSWAAVMQSIGVAGPSDYIDDEETQASDNLFTVSCSLSWWWSDSLFVS